jgi:hypothetical protein
MRSFGPFGLASLAVCLIIGLPSLLMTWELIDDLTIVPYAGRVFTQGDFSAFSDASSGLLRPGYWAFQGIHGLVFGESLLLWHAARLGWSLLIVGLFFKIIERVSGSPRRAALAAILFSTTTGAIENQYRLGTAEPAMIALQLLALLLMTRPTKARLAGACLAAAAAYTVKELAVVMLGMALLGAIFHRERRKEWAVFLAANAVAFAAIRTSAAALGSLTGDYSGRYGDPSSVVVNAGAYARMIAQNFNLLLPLALALGAWGAWKRKGDEPAMQRWAWMFLGFGAGSVALYLPFWICCRHYFIQAALGFSAFIALVVTVPEGRPSTARVAALVALSALALWDFAANWNFALQTHVRQSRFHAEVVRRIAERLPASARVEMYRPVKDGDWEPRWSMEKYLARRRGDLRFVEAGGDVRVARHVINPKLGSGGGPEPASPLHRMTKPFLQHSLAIPVRPGLFSVLEVEAWTAGP